MYIGSYFQIKKIKLELKYKGIIILSQMDLERDNI